MNGESPIKFEWDPGKNILNQKKHSIDFEEASSIFGDPLALTLDDPEHSVIEHRHLTIGFSNQARLLIIAHTERNERIRIISARKVTPRERKFYEEKNEKNFGR